jgi:Flp pilus assembly protein TadG
MHMILEQARKRFAETMKNQFKNFSTDCRGMAGIEAAFIFPILIVVLLGLYEFTSAFTVNRKVTNSAAIIADLVTRHNRFILRGDITDYYNAVGMIMAPIPAANVRVELFGYRKSGATMSLVWSEDNGQGSSCGAAPATTNMGPLSVAGNDLVVARVCTTYSPILTDFWGTTFIPTSTLAIAETITERPRVSLTLTCYAATDGGAIC